MQRARVRPDSQRYFVLAAGWFVAAAALAFAPVRGEVLETIVSREAPTFDCLQAVMTVGRDGNVYLSSVVRDGGFILRISRDGGRRFGGDAVYAMANATANAAGIIASANAHFNHSVNLYDDRMKRLAACGDFLNEGSGWDAPGRVDAGASGDFYGIDQRRARILRIDATGRVVKVHTIPQDSVSSDFRVCEAKAAFFLRVAGTIHCVGFDGTLQSKWPAGGVFTVDDDGELYVLAGGKLARMSSTGEQQASIDLPLADVTGIGVFADDLVVRRRHPTELFRVYALDTGELRHVVQSRHERLAVETPGLVWTAGERVPLAISFDGPGAPQWRVWMTPLGDTDWRELPLEQTASSAPGAVQVPAGHAGLYQVKIAPAVNGTCTPDISIRTAVEVRAAGSRGTVSVWTPHNRVSWGRGEAIPVSIAVRTTETMPEVGVSLRPSEDVVSVGAVPVLRRFAPQEISWNDGIGSVTLPAELTARLATGRYELRADVPGFTCVPQPIRLGPGLDVRPAFRVTQYGDYVNLNPGGLNPGTDGWSFANAVDGLLSRSLVLGVNQYVNRIHAGKYSLSFSGGDPFEPLRRRLDADPAGTASQKASFGFPQAHHLGALGSHGLREWLLLLPMDVPLPIGTSISYQKGRSLESWGEEIQRFTEPLQTLSGFVGWVWAANWWITDEGKRFATVDEKKAFDDALKRAGETGAWNPVLDAVGDRAIGWQVDAQDGFRKTLQSVDPRAATASAGPYRRPGVYPPISFANVDEVDLHFQAEQITCPDWTAHATDFYKRPGKPVWMHPELWNDTGTGEQILPMSWLAIMRGVHGIGTSGEIGGGSAADPRSAAFGIPSVFRSLGGFSHHFGEWLTRLENDDRVAIVVSNRQIKIDNWGGIGGRSFTRAWEAFMACLYARRPATFLFAEDVSADSLEQFKALLVVGQTVEPEPELAALLEDARQRGLTIFADGSCRPSLVAGFTPLGTSFDRIEKLRGMNEDPAFWTFRDVLLQQAATITTTLGAAVPPVGECDQPEVLLSSRRLGAMRVVWVVDNTFTSLDPGLLWRVQPGVATHTPQVATVRLPVEQNAVVYDLFSARRVAGEACQTAAGPGIAIQSDLRHSFARAYVILPAAVDAVRLDAPAEIEPGAVVPWRAAVASKGSPAAGLNPLPAVLPLRVVLRDGTGKTIDERFTVTGTGSLVAPENAVRPLSLSVIELVGGTRAHVGSEPPPVTKEAADTPPLFGPRLRDLVVSRDGATALVSAFGWDRNLYSVDLATGRSRWSGRLGDYFAFAPQVAGDTFAVQSFDATSGEGYHLHLLESSGGGEDGSWRTARRFAVPGLPARLRSWCNIGGGLVDRINGLQISPDGAFVAGAGNLGLAVWGADGRLMWSDDWSAKKRPAPRLTWITSGLLAVSDGPKITSYDAVSGVQRWSVEPATEGEILELVSSADGSTVVARSTASGGRVFVIREGRTQAVLPTRADELAVSPDGSWVAVANGASLELHDAAGGLRWAYLADAPLHFLRGSPRGDRLAASSELGMLFVFPSDGHAPPRSRDMGAVAATAWLPGGDLVAATWMGAMIRLDGDFHEQWRSSVAEGPTNLPDAIAADVDAGRKPPTVRLTTWPNNTSTPFALVPNLAAADAVVVRAKTGDRPVPVRSEGLFDGKADPPVNPLLDWSDVGMIDSGWRGSFSLEIDLFRTRCELTAITFAEDPTHPESWLRDARLEYWDSDRGRWDFSQYVTSDAAVHTHVLATPLRAARFRLTAADGTGWPASNLRLAEIVLHGKRLGASHADVVANRPVAVLFDEKESDVACLRHGHSPGFECATGQAAHGAVFACLKNAGAAIPRFDSVFGHVMPDWDFTICEHPSKPNEYRWLEFSWKATTQQTEGVAVRLAESHDGGWTFAAGAAFPFRAADVVKQADAPPLEWTTVRVDLWPLIKSKGRETTSIRSMCLGAVGGGAAFDRILLGRSEADLDAFAAGAE
jgi:hypothetical protein